MKNYLRKTIVSYNLHSLNQGYAYLHVEHAHNTITGTPLNPQEAENHYLNTLFLFLKMPLYMVWSLSNLYDDTNFPDKQHHGRLVAETWL